MASERRK